jgi:hypothetical protein
MNTHVTVAARTAILDESAIYTAPSALAGQIMQGTGFGIVGDLHRNRGRFHR